MNSYDDLDRVLATITGGAYRRISELNLLVYEIVTPRPSSRQAARRRKDEDGSNERLPEIQRILESSTNRSDLPLPSLLLDLGEIYLSLGEKSEAENCFRKAVQSNTSAAYIVASNPSLILNQTALFQAKLGLDATALEQDYAFLSEFPNRFPELIEGYRSLAMTIVDCMHISEQRYAKHKELIQRSIERIRRKSEREDCYGLVARKLCMRSDAIPSESDGLVDIAKKEFLPRLSDKLERLFTTSQIGVASALRGDAKLAKKQFDYCKSLFNSRSSDRIKYARDTVLLRAYAQAGFSSEAKEVAQELRQQFDEASKSAAEMFRIVMQQRAIFGGKFPKQLRSMTDSYIEMIDSYCETITTPFMVAGRYSKHSSDQEYYLKQARDMIEKYPVPGQNRFKLCMLLSTSYARNKHSEKSLETLRLGVNELKKAGNKSIIRDFFIEDIALACSENFHLTNGDDKFIDEFFEYGKTFSIKGKALSDASYLLLRHLGQLAKDEKWRVTFYVSST
ncbi:MAG: hypothetical protein HYY22_10050 [Thaumarchaeota archaeon]|nr:hypothetical protein [Nitrososphaerota archaeon]